MIIKNSKAKWNLRFFELAKTVSTWSKDPDCQVGCVIASLQNRIISMGYNGFPKHIDDNAKLLHNESLKNRFMIHAEANAILNARSPIVSGVLACTKFPCHECAKLIIQSGISKVIVPRTDFEKLDSKWRGSCATAKGMFEVAGVEIRYVEGL